MSDRKSADYYLELAPMGNEVTLSDISLVLYRNRGLIVGLMILFALLGAASYFFAPKYYLAEVVSTFALAGDPDDITCLKDVELTTKEAVEMLQSIVFISAFIEKNDLMPVLFEQRWDAAGKQWRPGASPPTRLEAYARFKDDILDTRLDPETDLVTISVRWTDPQVAATWANGIVTSINQHFRDRVIDDAKHQLAVLDSFLNDDSPVRIEKAIYSSKLEQLSKILKARVNSEYAFRVIDPAIPPEKPIAPFLYVTAMGFALILGFFVAFTVLVIAGLIRLGRAKNNAPGPVSTAAAIRQ